GVASRSKRGERTRNQFACLRSTRDVAVVRTKALLMRRMKKPSSNSTARRRSFFQKLTRKSARWTGHPAVFSLAVGLIAVWGITGPLFHFSDTWQLVVNTATTIIT